MKLKNILLSAAFATLSMMAQADAPRYIFYFIGDGMGPGQVMCAETYNRLVRGSDKPLMMMQFPVASLATTYSVSTPVTDSAAAGTALATGNKTINGMLGVTPDTTAVNSIAYELHNAGYGVGLVTTVPPDDATPGAFYAHVPHRSMYYEIGRQAAESGYEFIAGSMLRGTTDRDGNPTGLIPFIEKSGVKVVRGLDALAGVDSRRVMLLDTDSVDANCGYTIDSLENALTLPAMTAAAIDHLMKHTPDRFFMMVEGGNIDWAAHANDGGTVIKEVLNFDQALGVAYDFYRAHPDETLIIVTADHETGGMSVGQNSTGYNAYLQYIDYQKVSKDAFSAWCKMLLHSRRIFTWEDMKEYLTENFGFWTYIPVTAEEENVLRRKFDATFILRNSADQKTLYNTFSEFAVEVFDVMNRVCGIGWTSNAHTGNPVPVYAIGADAALFGRPVDNTDIPKLILKAAFDR